MPSSKRCLRASIGGLPTEATIAHVLVSKYADHLPLYHGLGGTGVVGTLRRGSATRSIALSNWRSDYIDHRPHSGLGWLTPAEFTQTINPNAVLRSRNGSAPHLAATAPNTATKTAGANSKLDITWGQGHS